MIQPQDTMDFVILLEPYRNDDGVPHLLIKCPQDPWIYNHLCKIPGVQLVAGNQLLMPNLPFQVRRLFKHVKGLGYWVFAEERSLV